MAKHYTATIIITETEDGNPVERDRYGNITKDATERVVSEVGKIVVRDDTAESLSLRAKSAVDVILAE